MISASVLSLREQQEKPQTKRISAVGSDNVESFWQKLDLENVEFNEGLQLEPSAYRNGNINSENDFENINQHPFLLDFSTFYRRFYHSPKVCGFNVTII